MSSAAAVARPLTVVVGVIALGIQVAMTLFFIVLALVALAQTPPATPGIATSWLLALLVLAINVVTAAALVLILRGRGAARFVPLVLGGIVVVLDLITLKLSIGDALWVVAIVLLFLPVSNAWFRAMGGARHARM